MRSAQPQSPSGPMPSAPSPQGAILPRAASSSSVGSSSSEDGASSLVSVVDVVPPPYSPYAAEQSDKATRVPYSQLFRFADGLDTILVIIGVVAATANGVAPSLLSMLLGDLTDAFVPSSSVESTSSGGTSVTTSSIDVDSISTAALKTLYIGVAAFALRFLFSATLTVSADRQANRIRRAFFTATLSQEIGWFDAHRVGEITTRVSDVQKINDGINEQLGLFFMCIAQFISCLVVGLIKGWKMTLVLLSCVPIIVISFGLFIFFFNKLVVLSTGFYSSAGQVAEEILSSIRTTITLGIQKDALQRYDNNLKQSMKAGYKKGVTLGLSFAVVFFVLFASYGLAFWYGAKLVMTTHKHVNPETGEVTEKGEMTPGQTLVVFFAIMNGAMSLSLLSPILSAFGNATGAAGTIFGIIDRASKIDPRSEAGEKLEVVGNIEFRDVTFRYPTRPETDVLKKYNLRIPAGKTVALVGPSGCGKSTLIGLIERFYDTEEGFGDVLIDGRSIKDLHLQHYRKQIGAVTQEPVLFATTVARNIAMGADHEVTMEEIMAAAKSANAHDFIMGLPSKYDTLVGERGAQLSGGQKQRVAIARALVRQPKILLFDEATSALDSESEAVVQAAIDEVSHGRTCVIVAHRLSTVRNADVIVVMRDGLVVEMGNHEMLMTKEGLYHKLVLKQQLSGDKKKKTVRNLKMSVKKSEDEQELQKLLEEEDATRSIPILRTLARAMRYMAPNWLFVLVSAVASVFSGAVFPVLGLLISQFLGVLIYIPGSSDKAEHQHKVNMWSLGFVLLGVVSAIANFTQMSTIEIAGERLSRYLRYESFKAMLRQEAGWFDDKHNSTGVLATRLATDATLVHGLTGQQICVLIQLISSIVSGVAIGFSGNWKLSLVVCSLLPVIISASLIDLRFLSNHQQNMKRAYERVGNVVSESLENIRTVTVLCRQDELVDRLYGELDVPSKKGRRAVIGHSLADAMNNFGMFLTSALAYWYGGKLMSGSTADFDFSALQRSLNGISFGAMAIGNIAAQLPSYSKAIMAASHIFELLDRKPQIPPPEGIEQALPGESDEEALARSKLCANVEMGKLQPTGVIENLKGDIELRDVHFEYPARPGVKILDGLTLHAHPRQTLALVGHSGCGKSTVISLVERLYAAGSGQILIDGRPIEELNPSWLRGQIGLVSQEPSLFAATIRENIAFGKPGATLEEIVAAARKANAHDFVSSFPKGYETVVGEKGVTLSGGQKQRIAIARALVRNPKILLLDEATAALDSASEAVVQDALDKARDGRTTIVVAHRLSTISTADNITVIEKGKVIEQGKHEELLRLGQHYCRLASNQMK